jgi:uncharacterized membrane protein YqiK
VRRPADAEAYRQRTLAEAARDTTKLNTEAEAFRRRQLAEASRDTTKLESEAEALRRKTLADADAHAARVVADADAQAINARADALAGENQALIAANKLVDMLPVLVEASAKGIEGSKLTILSGANGVNEVATGLAAQGLSIYETLRGAVASSTNGASSSEVKSEAPSGT